MVNYAVGAILTAEMRKHTRESIGAFEAGNANWYPWTSEQLLKFGAELDTAQLLEQFLGRPLSTSALIDEIASTGREPQARLHAGD
jgi:Zn-dependent M32 family carboxypeptidase